MKHPMRRAPNENLTSIIAGIPFLGCGEGKMDQEEKTGNEGFLSKNGYTSITGTWRWILFCASDLRPTHAWSIRKKGASMILSASVPCTGLLLELDDINQLFDLESYLADALSENLPRTGASCHPVRSKNRMLPT